MAKPSKRIVSAVVRYVQALEDDGVNVQAAYLFGSRAKGNHRPDSDIDVAVICTGLSRRDPRRTRQLWRPARGVDIRIEPVAFAPEDFVEENPLVWEIQQHGVRIK